MLSWLPERKRGLSEPEVRARLYPTREERIERLRKVRAAVGLSPRITEYERALARRVYEEWQR